MLGDPFLNYFALGLLIFVVIVIFYGIIAIHDIPAKIAEERHHPHADAIHAAGWVSLFTLHVLWPFLLQMESSSLSSALPAEFPKPKTMRGSHRPGARS
jgi:Protein of unknown function (DUF3302)